MKKLYLCLTLTLLFFGICSCKEKNVIRKDLIGCPLVAEDFSIVLNDKRIPAFLVQQELMSYFPDIMEKKAEEFFSIVDKSIPPRWDMKTHEFINDNIRYVYFIDQPYSLREGKNGYTSIFGASKTLRGIQVNDPIEKVIQAYGVDDWIIEHKESWHSGFMGFDYRLNYKTKINGVVKNVYDCIEFETNNGVVVGIYYYLLNSDEI